MTATVYLRNDPDTIYWEGNDIKLVEVLDQTEMFNRGVDITGDSAVALTSDTATTIFSPSLVKISIRE